MTDTSDASLFPYPPSSDGRPVDENERPHQEMVEIWRRTMMDMSEDELDQELVKLLQLIHLTL